MVVVNYSTTRYMKLMLATLADVVDLRPLDAIVIVDNGSRDGGRGFLGSLDSSVAMVHVVERKRWLHHGPALRAGVRRLDEIGNRSRTLLFCDPDVIFLDPEVLTELDRQFEIGADLVGEHRRRGPHRPGPNIQASFVAVRREMYERRDVRPALHHGAPLYDMQLDIERVGGRIVDLPTNRGGLILHRGRAAVSAASDFRPGSAYASVKRRNAHYMGQPNGGDVWERVEARYQRLLEPTREADLITLLVSRMHGASASTDG
jgi:hypothetical protein